tara:strand:+ start:291 stop:1487 length:1197 start_codon:yes stop_codon:yes gene_type:complete
MELFELKIDDELFDEVFAISLVSEPAIESNFVFFDKEKVQFKKIDNEKRIVAGPVLIPNKKILRVDGQGKPYEVFFSEETVEKLAQNYLKRRYNNSATVEHDEKVNGVSLVESWIKTTKLDKSNGLGLNLPVGSWVGLFKIDNDEIWNEYVKSGSVKGFSIEGIFTHDLVKASKQELLEIEEEEAQYLLNKIRAMIKEDNRYNKGKRIDMESYSDYPKSVSNNAKRGIELNERQDNKCGTQVGKVRAQQLAKGEPISAQTIRRMYSYLSRAETYYDPNKTTECGTISYLLWGGKAALGWSRNKLRELGLLEENSLQQPSVTSTYPGEVASGSIAEAIEAGYAIPEDMEIEGDRRKILFPSQEMAEIYAKMLGCEGSHPHDTVDQGTYYMACKTHPENE